MVTVLIIDDDADLRTLLGLLLQRYGCQTQGARNGIEGQRLALQFQPDLILLDIMMDQQDGYQTCANLRAAGYRGKIIMVSAISDEEGHSRATQCGADGYMQKPIPPDMLKKQIAALQTQAV